jgi:hypothetical protein
MILHNITLDEFIPHGKAVLSVSENELLLSSDLALNTNFARNDSPIIHYAELPTRYKLPFRIDMTVKLDFPALYLVVGKGHVEFGSGIDENRCITDILGNDFKPNTHIFDHGIAFGVYADISVMYGTNMFWVKVNGEYRCISDKEPYIQALRKNLIPEEFADGFGIKVACDKLSRLSLKSFTVIEYNGDEPAAPTEQITDKITALLIGRPKKSTLEECVASLAPDIKAEIEKSDAYLLKEKKSSLKFKRTIEGGYPYSRITYVSDWGFRYKIIISGDYVRHDINWVSYNSKREQEKYGGFKKADYMVQTLEKLAQTSPDFADEIYYRIKECVYCAGAGGCPNKSVYEFNGKIKRACGWSDGIQFRMLVSDFEKARIVVGAIEKVLKELNPILQR